jgi:hypothetical protein
LSQSKWLKDKLNLDIADGDLVDLDAMDNPRNLTQLEALGANAAERQVRPDRPQVNPGSSRSVPLRAGQYSGSISETLFN